VKYGVLTAMVLVFYISAVFPQVAYAGLRPGQMIYTTPVGCSGYAPDDLIECYSGATIPGTSTSCPRGDPVLVTNQYSCGYGIYSGDPACAPNQCAIGRTVITGDVCEVGGRETGTGTYSAVSSGISVRSTYCTSQISEDTTGAVVGNCGSGNFVYSDTSSAVWDGSEQKLVTCNSAIENKVYGGRNTGQLYCSGCFPWSCSPLPGDAQCESACGASPQCDELASDRLGTGNIFTSGGSKGYCDASCQFKTVECVTDDDCRFDSTSKLKMKCRSPSGTGGVDPISGQYTYRCTPGPCGNVDNSLCGAGSCCEGVVSGDSQSVICHPKGYVYGNNQLCDPGIWIKCGLDNTNAVQSFDGKSYTCIIDNGTYKWIGPSESEIQSERNNPNILELIISFFRNLLRM
jgi:hypothetical protein